MFFAYNDYAVMTVYQPKTNNAQFMLKDLPSNLEHLETKMEMLIAKLCSDYYMNSEEDIADALDTLKSMI